MNIAEILGISSVSDVNVTNQTEMLKIQTRILLLI